MFEKDEFEGWIKASHAMFETLEGRYDAYPLSALWIRQWFDSKSFIVQEEHLTRISALIEDFNYEIYGVSQKLKEEIDGQIKSLIENHLTVGRHENIGLAVLPFLATWNFWRYKKYFEESDFDLKQYSEDLGNFLDSKEKELIYFKNKRLLDERVDGEKVDKIFTDVNAKLKQIGVGNNEPIGTIKLLHVFSPSYFPLIDNDIAKAFRLRAHKYESLRSSHYLKWMNRLKDWLSNYYETSEKLERELQYSILKLVDEGLYVRYSVKLKFRLRLEV